MSGYLLKNANLIDAKKGAVVEGCWVRIEGNRIVEVSYAELTGQDLTEFDLGGKYLMPGLIDCHVHVIAATANLGLNAHMPNSLVAAHAARIMYAMLMRGFTTVRDVGGADIGLVHAVEQGLFKGPRLNICCKALSQTGGHTDYRGPYQTWDATYYTDRLGSLGRVCNGVDEVRKACRESFKGGANFIKIMANGGVSSPSDPIAMIAFSRDEVLAAVEEAENNQSYVSGHLYTDAAIRRAVECGVSSIEHANLIEAQTAALIADKGYFVVPTLITYDRLKKVGKQAGLDEDSVQKIDDVRLSGLKSLDILKTAGVKLAYGTDLLGDMHEAQSGEFRIRSEVFSPAEVIQSATTTAAELLRMQGQVGCIAEGAFADLLVLDKNPLEDLAALEGQGRHMQMIMKDGVIEKLDGVF